MAGTNVIVALKALKGKIENELSQLGGREPEYALPGCIADYGRLTGDLLSQLGRLPLRNEPAVVVPPDSPSEERAAAYNAAHTSGNLRDVLGDRA